MALTQREVIEHIRAARKPVARPRTRDRAKSLLAPIVKGITLYELERRYILLTLKRCDGNISEAARVLGIYRSSLQRRLRAYGARPSEAQTSTQR